ncbi:hypothetical protein LZ318_03565 [Saccharopolyspora indica]|uniref:IacB protein n=2 Tax=Saccharopolyspora TaxID=1835 RepID=A0A1I5K5C7_9PSEU|nr:MULTISPECIES: hypothetical protein [Saccharopolyspora]MDA3644994.1 hypothetical protein [Saccharopolyspora indica]RKT84805.1 hypothetical protein ATL45_3133 [Saccharopolyspora antimicrobica]SEG90432.1 hypothetical protein SAMN02982929_05230 [Saccharopolyspora kobensis]SFD91334.1 hypothetical protein SAMN05216506_107204 [Saccharopolyspora kobensis]SFO80168.1 hypothetical protein SAMN05421805_12566 [Saccharopolyspora antimicrobica]
MTAQPLRVLFCIGINQNFFDLPTDGIEIGDVWQAFVSMMDQLKALPGVDFIGDMDDDSHMVGPSEGWPWTCYILADVDSQETVKAACNLFRTTQVADGRAKLWRFARVEARMGRALTVREDVELPD